MSNLDEVVGRLIRMAARKPENDNQGIYIYRGHDDSPFPFEASYIFIDNDGDVGIRIP